MTWRRAVVKLKRNEDSYLDFGVTSMDYNKNNVLCLKILAPECMFSSNLKWYLEMCHLTMVNTPQEYFVRKRNYQSTPGI